MNVDEAERLAAAFVEAAYDIAEAVHQASGRPVPARVFEEARNGIVAQLLSGPDTLHTDHWRRAEPTDTPGTAPEGP
jgi:hypothetical protein